VWKRWWNYYVVQVSLPVILTYSGWSYWVFRGKVRGEFGYECSRRSPLFVLARLTDTKKKINGTFGFAAWQPPWR
jgi:hypothetical protein